MTVSEALKRRFGNIYGKKIALSNEYSVGIILGEQYFFRVNSDVAITIMLESVDVERTRVEVISSAGGTGMLEVSWSAHKAFVSDVKNYLKYRGFKFEVEEEIPYFKGG